MDLSSTKFSGRKDRIGFSVERLGVAQSSRRNIIDEESKTENLTAFLSKVSDKDQKASVPLKDTVKQQKRQNEKLQLRLNIEAQENKDLRNLSVMLNEYYHKTLATMEFKNENEISKQDITNLISNYNDYLISIIKNRVKDPSLLEQTYVLIDLNKKVSDLRNVVIEKQAELDKPIDELTIQKVSDQIKNKYRYLKKKYDDLDEFLRLEISLQKEEDKKSIAELERNIALLANELNDSKKKLVNVRSFGMRSKMTELMNQMDIILARKSDIDQEIEKLNLELVSSKQKHEQKVSKLDEMKQRLIVLQNMKKSMISD